MGDWCQLPSDVLHLILDRLSLHDSLRLGSVCPPWRSATAPSRHRGRLPWLLLSTTSPPPQQEDQDTPGNAWLDPSISFFSPLDRRLYTTAVPHLTGRRICGSSNGWLVTIHHNADIILINPLSAKFVSLPCLMNIPGVFGLTYSQGRYFFKISDQPGSPSRDGAAPQDSITVGDTFIKKAIVSSAREVIGIVGDFSKLLIHSPEIMTNRWLVIYDGKLYLDVTHCNGRFYAIDSVGTVVVIEGLDNRRSPFTSTIITGNEYDYHSLYLIESSGDLLKVVQFAQQTGSTSTSIPSGSIRFKVFKLDFEQVKWDEVQNLGDRAIFLSSTHSSSVSTSDFPECKGNCIYFVGDGVDEHVNGGIHKYNLEDGTMDTMYSNEHSAILPTPTWYASMQGQW